MDTGGGTVSVEGRQARDDNLKDQSKEINNHEFHIAATCRVNNNMLRKQDQEILGKKRHEQISVVLQIVILTLYEPTLYELTTGTIIKYI
jgi:hypothetical protein